MASDGAGSIQPPRRRAQPACTAAARAAEARVSGPKHTDADVAARDLAWKRLASKTLGVDIADIHIVTSGKPVEGKVRRPASIRTRPRSSPATRAVPPRQPNWRRTARPLEPITRLLFAEPSPAPLKAWLASQGWIADGLRAPFVPASPDLRERLSRAWAVLADAAMP